MDAGMSIVSSGGVGGKVFPEGRGTFGIPHALPKQTVPIMLSAAHANTNFSVLQIRLKLVFFLQVPFFF